MSTTTATSDNEPLRTQPMMPSSNGSYNSRRTWQTSTVERSNYEQPTRQRVPLPRPTYARRYAIPLPAHPSQEEQRSTYHSTESCRSMNDGQRCNRTLRKYLHNQNPHPTGVESPSNLAPTISAGRNGIYPCDQESIQPCHGPGKLCHGPATSNSHRATITPKPDRPIIHG
jgi:hypothetical protein